MRVLIVDDEALARSRLRRLLVEMTPAPEAVQEAANVPEALHALASAAALGQAFDVLLLDIHMPGPSGMDLARQLQTLPPAGPAVVFVTAHPEHALSAFEVNAADYLTKPVRRERLAAALHKVRLVAHARALQSAPSPAEADPDADTLLITDRGRTERVRLAEVLYFKSELKYVTVRTATHEYLWSGSLNDLEARFAKRYLRVHRNALVAPAAIRCLEKAYDIDDSDGWQLRLFGIGDVLLVSRRQLPVVRALLANKNGLRAGD
ncbi:two-component system response regulator AlgR [Comamonas sp. BIGb0152]|uniref:LytR/AlgR family response regulator transcription factor n=1 Tax=Comamonas sp. BIGb0152 TaxID=2940601 RepID=UPI002167B7E3|nr:LytTR family DNA-binding domain-containing protein [Comamonas sp. BIGb0152]MCS4292104.1 two-component system response regulator AlgR [Comamonas sp. BIGb0152]